VTPVDRITNSNAIVSVFGHWPGFHDAEVLGLKIAGQFDASSGPSLVAQVHVFSMTNEVDDRGYVACRNHSTVVLRFDGIDELALDGFNRQNALPGLVHFDAAYGMGIAFQVSDNRGAFVTPGIPPASVHVRAKA
jgi:hypothetical protein